MFVFGLCLEVRRTNYGACRCPLQPSFASCYTMIHPGFRVARKLVPGGVPRGAGTQREAGPLRRLPAVYDSDIFGGSLDQSRPFDLLVSIFGFISCHGVHF